MRARETVSCMRVRRWRSQKSGHARAREWTLLPPNAFHDPAQCLREHSQSPYILLRWLRVNQMQCARTTACSAHWPVCTAADRCTSVSGRVWCKCTRCAVQRAKKCGPMCRGAETVHMRVHILPQTDACATATLSSRPLRASAASVQSIAIDRICAA